jgi:molybdopterin-guanine dinucleotide biosynthesis protein A
MRGGVCLYRLPNKHPAVKLTGILLVGGASTRFGTPKALAEVGGETLALRAWRLLGAACDHRLAVGKAADALPLGLPLVDDGTPVRAALAGIVAGLRAAPTELCVVVPVDCPALTPAALRTLADACRTRTAAIPQSGPLPAALRAPAALPELEGRLRSGELRLRDAMAALGAAVVTLPDDVLLNVNTRAELERVA